MIAIGIDPAYAKPTAISIHYDGTLNLLLVDSYCWFTAKKALLDLELPAHHKVVCTIEGQEIYSQSRAKPEVILELSNRSGFFEGLVKSIWRDVDIFRPVPKAWKGQTPPKVYMKRTLKKWPILATKTSENNTQETEDLCHSFGLMVWGWEKYTKKKWGK